MSIKNLLALLLVFSLTIGFISCKKEEPKDETVEQLADSTKTDSAAVETPEPKTVSKENIVNFMKKAQDYMESEEYYTALKEAIKEASKTPETAKETLDAKMKEITDAKLAELKKEFGIENDDMFMQSMMQFQNDEEVKNLGKALQEGQINLFKKVIADKEMKKAMAKTIKEKFQADIKAFEEAKKAEAAPEAAAKEEPKKGEAK